MYINNNPHTLWGTGDIMSRINNGQTKLFLGTTQNKGFIKNIYHCGIKNIFMDEKVKEVYFLSTSLWWGHSSLNPDFMLTEGLHWIDELCCNANKVNIIVNTNLEKLHIKSHKDSWKSSSKLDSLGNLLCEILNKPNEYEIKYSPLIKPSDYVMYVIFEDSRGRERACKISFHNPLNTKQCGALTFTGGVDISRIAKEDVYSEFSPVWEIARPLKDALNELPEKVDRRRYYIQLVNEYQPKIDTLKAVFVNYKKKKWLEKLESGVNDFLEEKHDSSVSNFYSIFDAFSQFFLDERGNFKIIRKALDKLNIPLTKINYITGTLRHVRNKNSHGQAVTQRYNKEKAFRIMIETLEITIHKWSQSVA